MKIDVARQRLDSKHVFSSMATFGRTRLMATAIKRFLTQLQRHQKDDFFALPADFRSRYAVSDSRIKSRRRLVFPDHPIRKSQDLVSLNNL